MRYKFFWAIIVLILLGFIVAFFYHPIPRNRKAVDGTIRGGGHQAHRVVILRPCGIQLVVTKIGLLPA
jgi:hypothetical protein